MLYAVKVNLQFRQGQPKYKLDGTLAGKLQS